MEPALTPEEWADVSPRDIANHVAGIADPIAGVNVRGLPPEDFHQIAALALYGQPFGFTMRDVYTLDELACECRCGAVTPEEIWDIAKRIEALLPPETPGG